YNGWLPFFDTSHEDYFNDDLNIEDIKLIIWINLVRTGQPEGRIFSPFSPAVELMAESCYEILIEAFDKAPKASRIRDFIKITFAKRHYYQLRALSVWIGVDFPLTAVPFLRQQILSDAIELTEMYKESDFTMCYYMAECHVSWIKYCSFIGYSSMEILSVMAEDYGFPETAKLLKEIKVISPALYEIMERGKDFIKVRNVVDEEFLITLDSFKSTVQLNNVEGFLASIVRFGDSWYVNGSVNMFSQLPEKERERLNLNFIPESIKEKVREFIRNHDGKKLFYCKSEKAVGKLLGFATPKLNDEDNESGIKAKNILLVMSDTGLASIVPDVCQLFADPENKLYRKTADRDGSESLHLICSGEIPDDVAEYIQENHLLPNAAMFTSQGKEFGKKIVQENLRFLINFFRVNIVDVEELRIEEPRI
ncbi:MAG: DUF3843 family protein, partial [Muribaculaceae bacterium]|nr:DUF3843 family protein [Muribaculaceae bacterium]